MKKLIVILFLIVSSAESTILILNNDTNATYFALCGDIGSLLEPKKECTYEVPQAPWWQKFWNEPGVVLYKQVASGKFIKTFIVSPKKKDQSVTILVSDIHRKVRNVEQPFYVKTSKRVTSAPVKVKKNKKK